MREITIQVYKFEELSETAKEKARNWWRASDDEDYSEITDSIKEIGKVLGMRPHWEVGCYRDYVSFDKIGMDDDVLELEGVRALKYVWNNWIEGTLKGKYYGKLVPCEKSEEHPNGMKHVKYHSKATLKWNCPFTGTTYDYPLWEAWKAIQEGVKTGEDLTVEDFLEDLESRLLKEFQTEMEYRNSDEYIDETLVANEYEFYEDGSRF